MESGSEASPRKKSGSGLRIALVVMLGVLAAALLLDVWARSQFKAAETRLAEGNLSEGTAPATVHETIQRSPTSVRDVDGGTIEQYKFMSGVPWNSYVVRVGYAKNADEDLSYLDYSLDETNGDFQLEQVIRAYQRRISTPPVEEVVRVTGSMSLGIEDEYHGVQQSCNLDVAYVEEAQAFQGEVVNDTRDTLTGVRVLIRLADGTELGPQAAGDLESGSGMRVNLPASSDFESWTALVERDLLPDEPFRGVTEGAEVNLEYDAEAKEFRGTVTNTAEETIAEIHVVVFVEEGKEAGRTAVKDVAPEAEVDFAIKPASDEFAIWSARVLDD